MFVTIINDCHDANAMGRQTTRAAALFECPVETIGVQGDLEASGNLIDVLDSAEGRKGVVLVNVAPRHGRSKKWKNGSPFGYFYYKQTIVVASVEGVTLSLIKKLKVVDKIEIFDIATVLQAMAEQKVVPDDLPDRVCSTQFRSFEFLPRVALWLLEGKKVPSEVMDVQKWEEIFDAPSAIWWVDNFGNCKTTMLPEEIGHKPGAVINTYVGPLDCYTHLKDVPNNHAALIIGSSGLGSHRFLEIVVQGRNASTFFSLRSGSLAFQKQ